MEPLNEFQKRWNAQAESYARQRARVAAAALIRMVLEDLAGVLTAAPPRSLSLTEAAELSGYSAGHLGRLVKRGTIPNAGRPKAPRVCATNLPRKRGALPASGAPGHSSPTKKQIARQVVNSRLGERHDG
jgi:hypothetical protein